MSYNSFPTEVDTTEAVWISLSYDNRRRLIGESRVIDETTTVYDILGRNMWRDPNIAPTDRINWTFPLSSPSPFFSSNDSHVLGQLRLAAIW